MTRTWIATAPLALLLAGTVLAATDDEVSKAIAEFKKSYASKDESARLQAIETLSATKSKKVVETLAGPLAKDALPSVRRTAAKAIGTQWTPTAATTLIKALNPEGPKDVAAAIIEALGETEAEAAVPSLTALLVPKRRTRPGADAGNAQQDDPSELTKPALDALKKIGSPKAIEDLIGFLAKSGGGRGGKRGGGGGGGDPLAKEAEGVLEAITGEKNNGATGWRKWFDEKGSGLKIVQVYRCESTGKTWDHSEQKKVCPFDGDQHPKCGYFLKTRVDGVSASSGASSKKKGNKN